MESDLLNRLRRVAARQTLTLTHYGRRSGKPYEVTVWFVLDHEKFYIGTANVKCQWVRNSRGSASHHRRHHVPHMATLHGRLGPWISHSATERISSLALEATTRT